MATMENFVSQFHNLDGITLGEKQKSFRRLLNENASLLEDVNMIDSIIKKIAPNSYLEEVFKLEILLHCRRMIELQDIFISGNEILICKIIKYDWFIKKLCLDMDEQELVDKLLPCLSYAIRMKVLKKISLCLNNDDKVYIIFKAVKERYNLQVAMPLVLGCKISHIELILKSHPVKFTKRQLNHLIKKAPKLLPLYIEEHVRHFHDKSFINDNDLLRYIALIDYDVYSLLKKQYELEVYYGKRQSRKLFENKKEDILDNLDYYNKHLNKSIFVRKLGKYGAFKKYFCKAFVGKIEDFSCSRACDLLQYYPKKKQFQLLEQCFEQIYKIPLVDCPSKITAQVLKMVPDVNKREKMVEKKIQIDSSDILEEAVYLPTSKSIPIIRKEMALSTNYDKRTCIVRAFVTTCKINSDRDALKQVIEYIIMSFCRHDGAILDTFLSSLMENFDLPSFTKELWDSLFKFINVYKLEKGDMSMVRSILLMYLEFLYNSGESITDLLLQYMNNDTFLITKIWSHKSRNHKFIQDLFSLGLDSLSKVYNKNLVDSHRAYLLVEVLKRNKNHQENQIMIENRQEVYESLRKELEKDNFHYDLRLLICRQVRDDKIMEITALLWKKHLSDLRIVLYFLKWYPSLSEDYMKPLIEALSHFQAYQIDKVFQWIKKYDHLKLPANALNCCRNILDGKVEGNAHLVKYLARLMNPDDYIHFVEKYKPKKLSVDLINEEDKKIYKLQGQIVEGFSYVCSSVALTHVINYCGDDFLKYALVPLYKCFYRLPEDKLDPFFDKLVKKSVSVRKHGVFLAAQISDQEKIKNMLKCLLTVEKNIPSQNWLISATLNVFKQNASNEFWELFKYGLTLVDENDKGIFSTLVYVNYIPIDYHFIYYEEIWNLTANPKFLELNRLKFRNKLVVKIQCYVKDLPLAFCITIIETLFFRFYDELIYSSSAIIGNFIYEFLLHHKDPSRFDQIYQKIVDAKTSSLNAPKLKCKTFRKFVFYVNRFHDFWKTKGFSKEWNPELLKDFAKKLSDLYPAAEFFKSHLKLLLMINLIDLNEININECVVKVSEFWHNMVDKHGPYVIELLESTPIEYLQNSLESKTDDIDFVREYLKIAKSELDYIIAFKLCTSACRKADDIIKRFKACNSPYIQIQLRCLHMFSEYKSLK